MPLRDRLTLLLAGSKRFSLWRGGLQKSPMLSRELLVVASRARVHSEELIELSPKRN